MARPRFQSPWWSQNPERHRRHMFLCPLLRAAVAVDGAEEVSLATTDCTQLRTHEVCHLQLHELNQLNLEAARDTENELPVCATTNNS